MSASTGALVPADCWVWTAAPSLLHPESSYRREVLAQCERVRHVLRALGGRDERRELSRAALDNQRRDWRTTARALHRHPSWLSAHGPTQGTTQKQKPPNHEVRGLLQS